MEVNGKEFYHILTVKYYARKWKPGKTIHYRDKGNHLIALRQVELNDRIKDAKTDHPYLPENVKIVNKAQSFLYGDDFPNIFDFIPDARLQIQILVKRMVEMHNITYGYLNILNEVIFERVRERDYSSLPSRMSCAWLCDKGQVKKWWNEFSARDYKKVFKVAAYGDIIKVDRSWMPTDIATIDDTFNMAAEYWKGALNPNSRKRLQEYLFTGKLKVLEEVDVKTLNILRP